MKLIFLYFLFFLYFCSTIDAYCIYNKNPSNEVWFFKYKNENSLKNIIQPNGNACCSWNEKECSADPESSDWSTGGPSDQSTYVTVEVACSRWTNNLFYTKIRFPAGGFLEVHKSLTPGKENYVDVYDTNYKRLSFYRCGGEEIDI